MADRERDDSHKSSAITHGENETHRAWKSKWVESVSPLTDHPVDDEEPKVRNILGNDSPPDGGEKAT
jgi:hypothetical protein